MCNPRSWPTNVQNGAHVRNHKFGISSNIGCRKFSNLSFGAQFCFFKENNLIAILFSKAMTFV